MEILARVEGSILELLARHGPLADEQIASFLERPPGDVRAELADLRDRGLVGGVSFGKPEGNTITPASYWWLTKKGRDDEARRRGG